MENNVIPAGSTPMSSVDDGCWHYYLESFLPNGKEWANIFLSTEIWQNKHILVQNKNQAPRWIQGHRRWLFQSEDTDIIYKFSGITLKPTQFSQSMTLYVRQIRSLLNTKNLHWFNFNSVLMYAYENGDDYCRYHREDEPELGKCPVIGYLGLGDRRPFLWSKNQSIRGHNGNVIKRENHTIEWWHGDGDLLITGGNTQYTYFHSVPPWKNSSKPNKRIGTLLLYIKPSYHTKDENEEKDNAFGVS